MAALTGMPFLRCECVATRSVDQYSLSASVATVVNAIADPCVERRRGEGNDTKPITGINKASTDGGTLPLSTALPRAADAPGRDRQIRVVVRSLSRRLWSRRSSRSAPFVAGTAVGSTRSRPFRRGLRPADVQISTFFDAR
jgi:hypothetical protein